MAAYLCVIVAAICVLSLVTREACIGAPRTKFNQFCCRQVAAPGDVQPAEGLHGLGGGGARRGVARRRAPPHHPAAALDAHPRPPQAHPQKRTASAGAGAAQPATPPFHDQRPEQQRNSAGGQVTPCVTHIPMTLL
jgi:hypothetical protein